MNNDIAISMQNVDVLFGPKGQQRSALELLDKQQSRETILSNTGVVLGVANASLDIRLGSISVLMGLSGSGKSSLLRCVNGLNTVTRGQLHVRTQDGFVDVANCRGKALRTLRRNNLAMVFQQFALLPWASVRENIGFGLSVRGESVPVIRQRVDEQLELVGLEAWADKPIHTLSGGMQQRVGLARAFATNADILLMDEPFSALDPLIREHLQDELLALQSRLKKTIVFVSHDLDEALKLGNQISIMEGGRIVQTDSAQGIVFNPATDYVQRFVANINPLSVLTARSIMQVVNPEEDVYSHPGSGVQLNLANGKPVAAQYKGESLDLSAEVLSEKVSELPSADSTTTRLFSVNLESPIRFLLSALQVSQHPLLVLGDQGELVGVIDANDIVTALSTDIGVPKT